MVHGNSALDSNCDKSAPAKKIGNVKTAKTSEIFSVLCKVQRHILNKILLFPLHATK